MYYLKYSGESIGSSHLENGDPEINSVSGGFTNVGGPGTLAKWLKHLGGKEENGTAYFVLNEHFSLTTLEDQEINYSEATLIAIPESSEAYLDVTGIPEDDYKTYFPKHIAELENVAPEPSLQDRIKALKNKNIV